MQDVSSRGWGGGWLIQLNIQSNHVVVSFLRFRKLMLVVSV